MCVWIGCREITDCFYYLLYTRCAIPILRRDSFVRTELVAHGPGPVYKRECARAVIFRLSRGSSLSLSLTEATRIFEFFHVFDFPGTPNLSTRCCCFASCRVDESGEGSCYREGRQGRYHHHRRSTTTTPTTTYNITSTRVRLHPLFFNPRHLPSSLLSYAPSIKPTRDTSPPHTSPRPTPPEQIRSIRKKRQHLTERIDICD